MRLTIGGPLYTTDQWSNTFYFDSPGTDQPDEAAMLSALTSYQFLLMQPAKIGYWKYNEISKATGKYLTNDSHTHEVNPALSGSGTPVPPQLTMALSLRSDFTRGPAHAGRVYLPFAPAVGSDGRISSGDRDNYQAYAKLAIQGFVATKTHLPIIWSQKSQLMQPIRTLAIGRVVDTQRRRRKSLIEQYTPILITGS